jgi:flavin reductase (DIM6/NTAB) family NADH-FMN oxidoreductase RutF
MEDTTTPADGQLDSFFARTNYPILVVTTSDGEQDSGCLVGFATQCSIDPLRFLALISTGNHTYRVLNHSSSIAVHLLGQDQIDLAELFGEETGDMIDKFSQCKWERGTTGAPIIDGCASWFEGLVIDRFPCGDHHGFLIEPLAGGGSPGKDLLMYSDVRGMKAGHPID